MLRRLLILSLICSFGFGKAIEPVAKTAPSLFSSGKTLNQLQIRKTSQWIKDMVTSEKFAKEKQALLKEKRKALISELEALLRTEKNEARRLELNIRLGRLHIEDYFGDIDAAYRSGNEPAPSLFKASLSLSRARAIYGYLVKGYPNTNRRDEILYFFAVTSLDTPYRKEALKAMEEIVQRFPKSPFMADALVQLGDEAFEQRKWEAAEGYYDALIARKSSQLTNYAMYKKGWVSLNQYQYLVALNRFQWVLDNETKNADAPGIKLKSEILLDIPFLFVELKDAGKGIAFFQKYESPIYHRGVESMAIAFKDRGQNDLAMLLWDDMLTRYPTFEKNPGYELEIVEIHLLKNDVDGGIDKLFARAPLYLQSSKWYDAANSSTKAVASNQIEKALLKHALFFHDLSQKTKNDGPLKPARRLYTKHIELFPNSSESAQVRYNLGKLLFKQHEYTLAADSYVQAAKMTSNDKIRFDSYVQALASLDMQLTLERRVPERSKTGTGRDRAEMLVADSEQPLAYSDEEAKFVKLGDEFMKKYPRATEIPDVLYEQGYLQYSHYEFDKAYGRFARMAMTFRDHVSSPSASHLMLDILNRRKNYEAMVQLCKDLKQKGPQGKIFLAEISEIERRSELKRIQALEEDKEYAKAADSYMKYATDYGFDNASLHEKALYNAAANYTRAEIFPKALETREKFMRTFPKSALLGNVMLELAQGYQMQANFKRAGYYYGEFLAKYPKAKEAKDAMRLATMYAWGTGERAKAEKMALRYTELYPKDAATMEPMLLSMYESRGAIGKYRAFHEKKRSEARISPVNYLERTLALADSYGARGAGVKYLDEGLKFATKYERQMRKNPKGVEMLARLLFWSMQPREREFRNTRLSLHDMDKKLQRKLSMIKELEEGYVRIGSLGSEQWGLGAIYRTAMLYRQMAQEVAAAPIPKELSGPALDAYRKTVRQTLTDPFNEKAMALVTKCLEESAELQILSGWTGQCYALGTELKPDTYKTIRSFYLPAVRADLGTIQGNPVPETYLVSGYFAGAISRSPSAVQAALPWERQEIRDLSQGFKSIPVPFDYRVLASERTKAVKEAINPKRVTLSQLHLRRIDQPTGSLELIRQVLSQSPNNIEVHIALAMAYLDMGDLDQAELTFLALMGRGIRTAPILTDMALIEMMRGKERNAVAYLKDASQLENSGVANENLGFLALKYRNAVAAKNFFSKVTAMTATSEVGSVVAQLQAGETTGLKEKFKSLTDRFGSDPYVKLSTAYYLLDVEQNPEQVERVISEFLSGRPASEDTVPFEKVIQEAKRAEVATLPSIIE